MAFVNDNYCNLKDSYLFSQIAQKVNAYVAEHPEKKVIRMGIGDVTLPLAPAVIDAMQKAVAEMGVRKLSVATDRSRAMISCTKLS